MALGLLSAGTIAQDLSKPALFANLDKFGPTLQALPMTSRTISQFTDGRMPQGCRTEVTQPVEPADPSTQALSDAFASEFGGGNMGLAQAKTISVTCAKT